MPPFTMNAGYFSQIKKSLKAQNAINFCIVFLVLLLPIPSYPTFNQIYGLLQGKSDNQLSDIRIIACFYWSSPGLLTKKADFQLTKLV